MLAIRIENKVKVEWQSFKSKLRSLLLFGKINKVYFGKGVSLSGALKFGDNIHIMENSKLRGKNTIIGSKVFIHENVLIRSQKAVVIGEGTTINRNTCVLDNVVIGKYCSIAPNCVIVGSNHNFKEASQLIKKQGMSSEGITIGDDVWIGANVTILDGVVIGKGAVVAAGAVVNKSIPEYMVFGGVPAKSIGKRA
ncbi:acyltransferase [Winogradskyella marincola]|uniref:Acyltransferase n=1 Tax=Winogradskyella marincola TaxID=3037795 RepID=A0ABT6FYS9_9FLAO|nr:acyltransferase [Winogradskyella sp. YYF002]MDG4714779.1 acyltransferase [Winogradskyella sp. YYF002]